MKRIISGIFFLFAVATCSAQMSKHVGHYQGVIATDTLVITIVMDLYKDSTYTVSVKYRFPKQTRCGSGEKKFRGKWLARNNWIYFKHTSEEEPSFTFTNQWDKPPRLKKRMWKKGYGHGLKVIKDKEDGYKKIYVHFSEDCFEVVWDKRYLAKIE